MLCTLYGSAGLGSQSAFILQGGLRVPSAIKPRGGRMYTVAVTLAGTPSSSFGGCTIKLVSANITLHEEVVAADAFAGKATAMNYGDGVRFQFEMTAHRWFLAGLGIGNPAAADPLSIVVEADVSEGSVVVLDNVELCERSNQCLPVFPQCTSARLDAIFMVDNSLTLNQLQDVIKPGQ